VVEAHYKTDDLLNYWNGSSDISGYHANFHEGHGTLGAGQGRGMVCMNPPKECQLSCSERKAVRVRKVLFT